MNYARKIADESLKIKAITLSPDEPYTWASRYRIPIYNDNRKHLRYPGNRKIITDGFMEIINGNDLHADMIAGTMTAGIAPAASLAQELNVPINIVKDSKVFQYVPDSIYEFSDMIGIIGSDIIISTCPDAIIPAVFAANDNNLPLAYVREKKKEHGLEQQIEGVVVAGERMSFVDFHTGKSYSRDARKKLEEKGLELEALISEEISVPEAKTADFYKINLAFEKENKSVTYVEDLISTGGSCIKEIKLCREKGANITDCLAIFSYDFPETLQKFEDIDCRLHSILGYDQLIETALDIGYITQAQHEMLKEWREDPWNWGEKHGFPRVEK